MTSSSDGADPTPATIEAELDRGLPAHPVPDFDERIDSLAEQAREARRKQGEHESRLLDGAIELIERTETELELVEQQLRQLDTVRADLDQLGRFGDEGRERAAELARKIGEHRDRLRATLDNPALQDARQRRDEQRREAKTAIADRLTAGTPLEEVDEALARLTRTIRPSEYEWAATLVDDFERDLREAGSELPLGGLVRFWRHLRGSLSDGSLLERAREKSKLLRDEIGERQAVADARAELQSLTREIKTGVEHLDHLGEQERIAIIHLWLGKLRRLQDEFDLEQTDGLDLYHAFGRINRKRQELAIDHWFDALNRRFSTDWDAYIDTWQRKIEQAREHDRLRADAQRRRDEEAAERQRREEARQAGARRKLDAAIEALGGFAQPAGGELAPDDVEDVRSVLLAGVEADGCQSETFLEAARPFSSWTYGSDLRGLRRSLKRIGVDEAIIGSAKPPPESHRFEKRFAELRPQTLGKKLLIAGGLANAATEQELREGLGLDTCRWYEHYRTDNHADARAAIQGGEYDGVLLLIRFASHKIMDLRDAAKAAGTPVVLLDRGCGTTALLRGVEELLAGARAG